MRKSTRGKIIFWLVLTIVFALLYFQNRGFFDHTDRLVLDLFVFGFSTPTLPVLVFYLGFFFAGLTIGFLVGFVQKFRARKHCQKLELRVEELTRAQASPEPEAGPETARTETPSDQKDRVAENVSTSPGPEENSAAKSEKQ